VLDCVDVTKHLTKSNGVVQRTYTDEEKRFVRYLYEVEGKYLEHIADDLGISISTVKGWKAKQVWSRRGKDNHQIEQFTRERFLQLASAKGMPKKKAVKLLIEGMTKPSHTTVLDACPKDAAGKDLPAKTLETPDYTTRQKYQKDYWTLAGLYSTNKQMEVNANAGGTVNIQVNIPDKSE